MPKEIRILAFSLVAMAGLLFLSCILVAGYYSLWVEGAPDPDKMPRFLAENATAIGAVLGTNLGAALGIRRVSQRWRRKKSDYSETLRIAAAWFYTIALLIGFVFWAMTGFEEDIKKVVATLPELSRTLAGVIVGTLAVMLGVED